MKDIYKDIAKLQKQMSTKDGQTCNKAQNQLRNILLFVLLFNIA